VGGVGGKGARGKGEQKMTVLVGLIVRKAPWGGAFLRSGWWRYGWVGGGTGGLVEEKVVFGQIRPEGRDRLLANAFDHVPAVDRRLALRVGFKV